MRIVFQTLVLDGMPFITRHYEQLEKLSLDWEWRIAEGVSAPVNCTSWCSPLAPRLSKDGTSGYLESLAAWDSRVKLWQRELWHGKVTMLNELCKTICEPCLLWQLDADELWTKEQIEKTAKLFEKNPRKNCAYFRCRYFVGRDIVLTNREGFGNNSAYEWHRVWRIRPAIRWESHEPPKLAQFEERPFTQDETEKARLVFDHHAYSTEAQVAFKEAYYGSANNEAGELYKGGVEGWRRLQANRIWPVKNLEEFLPWMKGAVAERL